MVNGKVFLFAALQCAIRMNNINAFPLLARYLKDAIRYIAEQKRDCCEFEG